MKGIIFQPALVAVRVAIMLVTMAVVAACSCNAPTPHGCLDEPVPYEKVCNQDGCWYAPDPN